MERRKQGWRLVARTLLAPQDTQSVLIKQSSAVWPLLAVNWWHSVTLHNCYALPSVLFIGAREAPQKAHTSHADEVSPCASACFLMPLCVCVCVDSTAPSSSPPPVHLAMCTPTHTQPPLPGVIPGLVRQPAAAVATTKCVRGKQ